MVREVCSKSTSWSYHWLLCIALIINVKQIIHTALVDSLLTLKMSLLANQVFKDSNKKTLLSHISLFKIDIQT